MTEHNWDRKVKTPSDSFPVCQLKQVGKLFRGSIISVQFLATSDLQCHGLLNIPSNLMLKMLLLFSKHHFLWLISDFKYRGIVSFIHTISFARGNLLIGNVDSYLDDDSIALLAHFIRVKYSEIIPPHVSWTVWLRRSDRLTVILVFCKVQMSTKLVFLVQQTGCI